MKLLVIITCLLTTLNQNTMKHVLPKLPYELNALEPIISQRTLEFHHLKHHQAYVNNLNNLIPETKFADMSLEEIIKESDGSIFNNAAQVWNHTFYFLSLTPNSQEKPEGKLAKAIDAKWGSFKEFQEEFNNAGATVFGSGWAWLVKDDKGELHIVKESNAGNPMTSGFTPLLTFDVWEHAYYLDYQNMRPDYLSKMWKIVDWDVVEKRFKQ